MKEDVCRAVRPANRKLFKARIVFVLICRQIMCVLCALVILLLAIFLPYKFHSRALIYFDTFGNGHVRVSSVKNTH